jgi:hypothetical protein
MKRAALLLVSIVLCGGCSSGPSRHDIEVQLNKYHVFAEPETWYVCLGDVYNDELYDRVYLPLPSQGCRSSLLNLGADPEARQIGLTALVDGGPDTTFLDECSQKSTGSAILVCRSVTNPILAKVVLTDKGRQYLQAPGSIVKDNEAAFVVAHFQVLRITEVHREGPDSVVASFEWQQQPTEVGRLFEPSMGLHTHIAKALFRLNEKKEWTLVSPDETPSDPHYREFSIYSQVFEAIAKERNK